MEQLRSHWTDFQEILHLYIFKNPVEKIQVLLKYDKNARCFPLILMHIYDNISVNSYQNEKCFRQKL